MVPTDEWIQAAKYDETLFSTMNPNVLNALVERFRALDGDSDQYLRWYDALKLNHLGFPSFLEMISKSDMDVVSTKYTCYFCFVL